MTRPQTIPRKRYGLYVLAILLLLAAGVGMYFGTHNFQIRSLGLSALIAAMYCARISRVHARSNFPLSPDQTTEVAVTKGPSRRLWLFSAALMLLLVIAFSLMCNDAVTDGGNATWPVDVFAGVAVVCTIVWSYLAAKIVASKG